MPDTIQQALEISYMANLILENNETIDAAKAIDLAELIHDAQEQENYPRVLQLLRKARMRL